MNLTRFSLLIRKSDFFLEGRGLFDFARSGQATSSTTVTPALFTAAASASIAAASFRSMSEAAHRERWSATASAR